MVQEGVVSSHHSQDNPWIAMGWTRVVMGGSLPQSAVTRGRVGACLGQSGLGNLAGPTHVASPPLLVLYLLAGPSTHFPSVSEPSVHHTSVNVGLYPPQPDSAQPPGPEL